MAIREVNKTTGDTNRIVAGGTLYADNPIGSIIPYGGTTAPSGFLLCDGTAISRTTYSELFAVIGTAFGAGDGSTTFNLPDMREAVPKGAGLTGKTVGAHLDADGLAVGEFLDDRLENHVHIMDFVGGGSTQVNGISNGNNGRSNLVATHGVKTDSATIPSRSGATTEVKSVGVNYIIKAKMVAVPADFLAKVDEAVVENNEYSTTETVVGKWINGKPIYRKVYTGLSASIPTGSNWMTITTAPANWENLVSMTVFNNNTDWTSSILSRLEGNYIQGYPCSGLNVTINTIIIEYTKTT